MATRPRASAMVDGRTSAAGHPPAYYALVGWIGRIAPSAAGFYLMRLVSVMLCATAMWIGAEASRRSSRGLFPTVAVLVAFSPTAAFLAGSVNPSSFEILATFAVMALCVRALDQVIERGRADAPTVAALAIMSTVLGLTRPLSFAFVGLAVLAAAIIALDHVRRLRSPSVLATIAAGSLGILAGLGWVMWAGHLSVEIEPIELPQGFSTTQQLLAPLGTVLMQAGGQVNSMEAGPSLVATGGWSVAGLLVLLIAYLLGTRRLWISAALTTAGAVALPALANVSSIHTYGFVWQGRYGLPMFAVAFALAAFAVRTRSLEPLEHRQFQRLVVLLCGALAVAQLSGYWYAMYRWTVGMGDGMWWPFAEEWTPPLPAPLLLVTMAAVCVALVVLLPAVATGDMAVEDGSSEGSDDVRRRQEPSRDGQGSPDPASLDPRR